MTRASLRMAVLVIALALLTPPAAEAQASPSLTGLGYGVVGLVAGAYLTAGATCEGFICIPEETLIAALVGAALGGIGGGALANSANRSVAQGRPVGGGQLGALSFGTVLGGAALGALAGALVLNGFGSPGGNDEATVAAFTLAGAGLGVLQLSRSWTALTGRVDVQPTVMRDMRPGVVARVAF